MDARTVRGAPVIAPAGARSRTARVRLRTMLPSLAPDLTPLPSPAWRESARRRRCCITHAKSWSIMCSCWFSLRSS